MPPLLLVLVFLVLYRGYVRLLRVSRIQRDLPITVRNGRSFGERGKGNGMHGRTGYSRRFIFAGCGSPCIKYLSILLLTFLCACVHSLGKSCGMFIRREPFWCFFCLTSQHLVEQDVSCVCVCVERERERTPENTLRGSCLPSFFFFSFLTEYFNVQSSS